MSRGANQEYCVSIIAASRISMTVSLNSVNVAWTIQNRYPRYEYFTLARIQIEFSSRTEPTPSPIIIFGLSINLKTYIFIFLTIYGSTLRSRFTTVTN